MYDRVAVSGFVRETLRAFTDARPSLVVVALVLYFAGLVVTAERWRLTIAALGSRVTLMRAMLVNLAGIFVRNATPATGLGGDASRIALLRAEGVPLAQAAASFAYVRLSEVVPLVVVVALSTPAALHVMGQSTSLLAAAAAAVALAGGAVWFRRGMLRDRLNALWQRTTHVRISPMAMLGAIGYATLAQIESIARLMVVAAAFGVTLSVQQASTITVMTIVGGFVPTVGSIGAIDGSYVAGLMMFGTPAESSVAITILGRAISYGLSTAAGAGALALLGGRGVLRIVASGRNLSGDRTNTAGEG